MTMDIFSCFVCVCVFWIVSSAGCRKLYLIFRFMTKKKSSEITRNKFVAVKVFPFIYFFSNGQIVQFPTNSKKEQEQTRTTIKIYNKKEKLSIGM